MESIFGSYDSNINISKSSLIVKGMPEAILPVCTFYLDKDGDKVPLLEKDRKRFYGLANLMGNKGLRPVLITYLLIPDSKKDDILRNNADF